LVNKNDGVVTTDFATENAGLSRTPGNYLVIDCYDGECKRTQGYVKNESNVYAFVGDSTGVNISGNQKFNGPTTKSNCASGDAGNVGQVITDKNGVCYGNGSSEIRFENTNDKYIILKGAAKKGTPFEDAKNAIMIRHSANYILKDQFSFGGNANFKNYLIKS